MLFKISKIKFRLKFDTKLETIKIIRQEIYKRSQHMNRNEEFGEIQILVKNIGLNITL